MRRRLAFLMRESADQHTQIGRLVLHYRITARLGSGGMGVVYKALDEKLQRSVALKFLSGLVGSDDNLKRRLLQEAKSASALRRDCGRRAAINEGVVTRYDDQLRENPPVMFNDQPDPSRTYP